MIDILDGAGFELAKSVTYASEGEFNGVFPVANPHDVMQSTMVLDLVLEFIVVRVIPVQVTPESNDRQHNDMPVIHAGPADISSRLFIEVASN